MNSKTDKTADAIAATIDSVPGYPKIAEVMGEHMRDSIRAASEPTKNINDVVRESYAIAKEKGWWDRPRPKSLVTLLILSEISEVLEDHRNGMPWDHEFVDDNGKPMGPPSEMADVIIRIADYCGYKGYELELTELVEDSEVLDPIKWLALAAAHICEANEFGEEDEGTTAYKECMEERYSKAVSRVVGLAQCTGVDLWAAIDRKQRYNRTRPYRHGNKQA
jgi:hypothetical protein